MGNLTLDDEFRVYGMLKYAFISAAGVLLANWHGKSISKSTDMTQTSGIKRHMYNTNTKTERYLRNLTLD